MAVEADRDHLPVPAQDGQALNWPERGPQAHWDAGDLGCGELVVVLRSRLASLAPGSLFQLVARDPGAPEDLPAWCRLTGHELVKADPPTYLIKRKA
ncbi:MAG: sulfurtransferase TusA family protein [Acidimicrobiales bacterium]